jgi:CRP-like cAMP-binding protein
VREGQPRVVQTAGEFGEPQLKRKQRAKQLVLPPPKRKLAAKSCAVKKWSPMSSLEFVQFNPDDILFIEGESTFFFYILKEGQVEVYRETESGQRIILAVIDEGQSLGELAMIDKQPRSASARALTQVVAVKVSEEAYAKLLEELPSWIQSMLEGLVSRLRKANEIIRKHEAIDEQTKSGFSALEYGTSEHTKTIEFEIDFSNLSEALPPELRKKTG